MQINTTRQDIEDEGKKGQKSNKCNCGKENGGKLGKEILKKNYPTIKMYIFLISSSTYSLSSILYYILEKYHLEENLW